MFKVLIVDDEAGYRENLALSLERTRAVVRTAANGRDAIEIGVELQPDVLVIDWMLKHHVHGLQVAETLRVVWPQFHTLLITGFPSYDLKNEAERFGTFEFLEKPFDVASFRAAVERASVAEKPPAVRPPTAVAVIEPSGLIKHYNARARELFAWTSSGRAPANFYRLFDPMATPDLDAACENAIDVFPEGPLVDGARRPLAWQLEARKLNQGRSALIAFRPREEIRATGWPPSVRLLLGHQAEASPWSGEGSVLVVSEGELVRRVIVETLQANGFVTLSAESPAEGLKQFLRDPTTRLVILDTVTVRPELTRFVEELRSVRPGTKILGSCDSDEPSEIAALGADHFLPRYWRIEDLNQILRGESD